MRLSDVLFQERVLQYIATYKPYKRKVGIEDVGGRYYQM